MGGIRRAGKRRYAAASGSLLVEAAVAMTVLSVLGLLMLKMTLNITAPRQWTLQQTLTDAYMTYEKAYAQRIPFEELTSEKSPWPKYKKKKSEEVEIGRLPGGRVLKGTVFRTRFDITPKSQGGASDPNPAGMEVWRVQSILHYEIGGREYVKTRTVIRFQ